MGQKRKIMKFENYIIESQSVMKLKKAEEVGKKLFAFLSNLVDEIEKEVMDKEGRKIQIQGQKVKLKTVNGELDKVLGNLKRFTGRV